MNHREVLRQNAKSFFWAWLFLPRVARGPVAELYAFCRRVDDLADGDDADRYARLTHLRAEISAGSNPITRGLETRGVRRKWFLDLLDGAIGDLDFERPKTWEELDRYCYRVAGVVGLMMCPLLGVTDEAAWRHAVDLGKAMQLTNIARDVAEDLAMGRIYVPADWNFSVERVRELTKRLLARAEPLYASGAAGYPYLPRRARFAIAVAARIYRAIGAALARQDFDPFRGRAYVSGRRKVGLSLAVLLGVDGTCDRHQLNTHRE